jgi:predicted DNA-binding transcriptional regulator YafY
MSRTSDLARFERLDFLATRLKADEPLSVGDLAQELGVSRRTLTRDIELLRDRGLPVEADRGRGGGVRLSANWDVGRIHLGYREAVDLLVSLAVAEQTGSPILMANLAPIRRKLMASFSSGDRGRINQLKARLLIGGPASAEVMASHVAPRVKVVEALHEAFVMMQPARILYVGGTGSLTERLIEAQYLLLNYPVWYVLAYDTSRQGIRTFRCDRLRTVRPLNGRFRLRPVADFRAGLEGVDIVMP